MDIISSHEFNEICHHKNVKTIKYGYGKQPKVFEKDGNTIIKLFYPKKRLLSSDKYRPYALRFQNNILSLRMHGYDVPNVIKTEYCSELKIYLVYYQKIEGEDIRGLANKGKLEAIQHVADLIADLHQKGIFFRSIHLENLLYKPDGTIALLDITDVRFQSTSLTMYSRYRNLKHLLQEPNDRALWQAFGISNFLKAYFKSTTLSTLSKIVLTYMLKHAIKTS
ncbi:MAG: hypothetical protein KIT56_01390 [Gammaproteobacteria bacterium]|nr:hypothetical protein [Gammaproteobacteria bacterium]MCW5582539.1 hypothetical protein [Gammaproteobacteria bacterium]